MLSILSSQPKEISFCAKYSIRGNVTKLLPEEYQEIKAACLALGRKSDMIDIFIPNPQKHSKGNIPMAMCINGKMRAFSGPYKDGDVASGILKGIKFAKENLFTKELTQIKASKMQKSNLISNRTIYIPRVKHGDSKNYFDI